MGAAGAVAEIFADFEDPGNDSQEWREPATLSNGAAVDRWRAYGFQRLPVSPAFQAYFDSVADAWEEETRGYSFIHQITRAPQFAIIASMGLTAAPLMLRRLSDAPERWTVALALAARNNLPEAAGSTERIDDAVEMWLDWGRARGYI